MQSNAKYSFLTKCMIYLDIERFEILGKITVRLAPRDLRAGVCPLLSKFLRAEFFCKHSAS